MGRIVRLSAMVDRVGSDHTGTHGEEWQCPKTDGSHATEEILKACCCWTDAYPHSTVKVLDFGDTAFLTAAFVDSRHRVVILGLVSEPRLLRMGQRKQKECERGRNEVITGGSPSSAAQEPRVKGPHRGLPLS